MRFNYKKILMGDINMIGNDSLLPSYSGLEGDDFTPLIDNLW